MTNSKVFIVDRHNFTQSKWINQSIEAGENQVLFKVDRVALTSNNTTYAMLGQQMHYWDFFQSYSPDPAMGIVPVWGFAEVVESHVETIKPGERYYGFWPFSQYAVVTPEKITESGFLDATPPKPNLALIYRAFQKIPGLSPQLESFNAIFRPLGSTAYLLANELSKKVASESVTQVVISSASSKTALATGAILKAKLLDSGNAVKLTGLTSSSNKSFVESTEFFDDVVLYDDISSLLTSSNTIYVDFSGNQKVQFDVHQRFNSDLLESVSVGATDWLGVTKKRDGDLPGPTPYIFFAPTVFQETAKEMGAAAVAADIEKSMLALGPLSQNMAIKELSSEDDIQKTWDALLAGKVTASQAMILRF